MKDPVHDLAKGEKRKSGQVRGPGFGRFNRPVQACSSRPVDRAGKILDRNEELASRHRFFQQTGEHYSANRRKVHICFRAAVRCFQHSKPQVGDRGIERLSIDTVAVMNEEPIRMLRGDRLAQLLQRPSCRRIRLYIPMEKTA